MLSLELPNEQKKHECMMHRPKLELIHILHGINNDFFILLSPTAGEKKGEIYCGEGCN